MEATDLELVERKVGKIHCFKNGIALESAFKVQQEGAYRTATQKSP